MDENLKKQELILIEKCHEIDNLYENYAKSCNLTYCSLSIIECIYENKENCTQKEIVEETHYPKQNVNLVIKNLLDEGFIHLKELKDDRRNKRIEITKKGKAYFDKILLPLWKIDEVATCSISNSDREIFLKCIEQYEKVFSEEFLKLSQSQK